MKNNNEDDKFSSFLANLDASITTEDLYTFIAFLIVLVSVFFIFF